MSKISLPAKPHPVHPPIPAETGAQGSAPAMSAAPRMIVRKILFIENMVTSKNHPRRIKTDDQNKWKNACSSDRIGEKAGKQRYKATKGALKGATGRFFGSSGIDRPAAEGCFSGV
jgi:hypothetical protein